MLTFLALWIAFLTVAIGFMIVGLGWSRWRSRVAGRRRQKMGQTREHRARKLLLDMGFTIQSDQPQLESVLIVNDEERRFPITPDFLVALDDQEYVVEVKGGTSKWSAHADTRRQVLEYLMSTGLPCLLVNVETRQYEVVELPPAI